LLQIIPCGVEQLDEMVRFIVRLNENEAHHIAYFGVGEVDVRSTLAECVILPLDGFFIARENDKLIGVFGVDADPEIGRAWLLGPLIEHDSWQSIADDLFARVNSIIPGGIYEQELFFDSRNNNLINFAERHHFYLRSETAICSLLRESYKPAPAYNNIINFTPQFFKSLEQLHDKLFPNTYYTAKQLVEKQDQDHQLLIAKDEDKLLGYLFGKIEKESAYVDFLGTVESARGKGVGAGLLASGLDWMFDRPSTHTVNLTVNSDNTPARNLYQKFGFVCERMTRGYRKQVSEKRK